MAARTGRTGEKLTERIRECAASYLARESDRTTLITVTHVALSKDRQAATALVTVLPEGKEAVALSFLKRHRSDFKRYLKTHVALKHIPFVDFEIDRGEKNRQRVDELTGKTTAT